MGELQNLSKQINFTNLINHFKDKSGTKGFIGLKVPLSLSKSIRNGYTTQDNGINNKELNQM